MCGNTSSEKRQISFHAAKDWILNKENDTPFDREGQIHTQGYPG